MFVRHSHCKIRISTIKVIGIRIKIIVVIVYMDDAILTGDDVPKMNQLKTSLSSTFEIKDLGSLRYFLDVEVARSKKGIVVSQQKYVLIIFRRLGWVAISQHLRDDKEGDPMNEAQYQK